jgi:hypothetical protein
VSQSTQFGCRARLEAHSRLVAGSGLCRGMLRYPGEMDVRKMIAELSQKRDQIAEAILALERLALGQGKRRGRPPAWMTAAKASAPKRRGRPPGSKNKPKEKAGS